MYEKIGRELDKDKNPRLWAAVKQNEAELLRLIGQRQTDPAKALQALKASFELYQKVLTVISKETAPNHWALLCAEMGHTIVAALPLLGEDDQKRMRGHAVAAFQAARRLSRRRRLRAGPREARRCSSDGGCRGGRDALSGPGSGRQEMIARAGTRQSRLGSAARRANVAGQHWNSLGGRAWTSTAR